MSKALSGYVLVIFTDGFKAYVRLSDFGTPNNKGGAVDTLVGSHGKIKEIQPVDYLPT